MIELAFFGMQHKQGGCPRFSGRHEQLSGFSIVFGGEPAGQAVWAQVVRLTFEGQYIDVEAGGAHGFSFFQDLVLQLTGVGADDDGVLGLPSRRAGSR
ncbi:hypothetical protein ACFSC4_15605 [Deinococcus malanensis]|uniref:hypothetical protein n=1 Tax=Deinococcus malanensis TaxID=1706855 RepID=UPI00363EA705